MTLRIVHRTSGGSEQRGVQPGDDGDPCQAQNSHSTPHTLLSEGCVGALSVLCGAPTDTSIRDHGVLLSGSSLHGAAPLGLPWFCLVNPRESKEGSTRIPQLRSTESARRNPSAAKSMGFCLRADIASAVLGGGAKPHSNDVRERK